ncbi:MAG: hypothetical protein M1814_005065 [Vezdaea aestivalis]|nr:MAG: hypothetical protein M1814_005065 [Vezdaea aestivalis]
MDPISASEFHTGRRVEEADWDFSDPRKQLIEQWDYVRQNTCLKLLTPQDGKTVKVFEMSRHKSIVKKVSAEHRGSLNTCFSKLADFNECVRESFDPSKIDLSTLLSVFDLIIDQACSSESNMELVVEAFGKIRRQIDLFVLNYNLYKFSPFDELVECSSLMLKILTRIAAWIQSIARSKWNELDDINNKHLESLNEKIHHIELLGRQEADVQNAQERRETLSRIPQEPLENCKFPQIDRPFNPSIDFVGREDVLNSIDEKLNPHGPDAGKLRTHTLHGKRGVGKTSIAAECLRRNTHKYDAIFWIGCETLLEIKRSFTRIALLLDLKDAEETGHDDENALHVMTWLERTNRKWLLVYDNAEEGHSVATFDTEEGFKVLMRLAEIEDISTLDEEDIDAGRQLVDKVDGLALAIQQLATLLKLKRTQGSCKALLLLYESTRNSLKEKETQDAKAESRPYKALNVVWTMSFEYLTENARNLLNVLCFLPPDNAPVELFCPPAAKADVLGDKLAFCKFPGELPGGKKPPRASKTSPALNETIVELVNARLISLDRAVIRAHRMLIEGNLHLMTDRQTPFNTAVALVHTAFPNQEYGEALFPQAKQCQAYAPHALLISEIYEQYRSRSKPKKANNTAGEAAIEYTTSAFLEVDITQGYVEVDDAASSTALETEPDTRLPESFEDFTAPPLLTSLLGNCSWYFQECGDNLDSIRMAEICLTACPRDSIIRGHNLYTIATCRFDLNDLRNARSIHEESKQLKMKHLNFSEDRDKWADLNNDAKAWIAGAFHTEGNILSGEDRWDEALGAFEKYRTHLLPFRLAPLTNPRSEDLRSRISAAHYDEKNTPLYAITAMGNGRTLVQQAKYGVEGRGEEAEKRRYELYHEASVYHDQALELLRKCVVPLGDFEAHYYFSNGNLEYYRGRRGEARLSFHECAKILRSIAPISVLLASTYYKLACLELDVVEPQRPNGPQALSYLQSAENITRLKIRGREDDGNLARILWKKHRALQYVGSDLPINHTTRGFLAPPILDLDAQAVLSRAVSMRYYIESVIFPFSKRSRIPETPEEEERHWNELVAPFFR